MGVGMVPCKILDQYPSSYQTWTKSVVGFGNNEVLNTLTKTLTFVDADANANANAGGSTIALRERCSGELKLNHIKIYKKWSNLNTVKISFYMVAVPLIKFVIKDVKMTKKH